MSTLKELALRCWAILGQAARYALNEKKSCDQFGGKRARLCVWLYALAVLSFVSWVLVEVLAPADTLFKGSVRDQWMTQFALPADQADLCLTETCSDVVWQCPCLQSSEAGLLYLQSSFSCPTDVSDATCQDNQIVNDTAWYGVYGVRLCALMNTGFDFSPLGSTPSLLKITQLQTAILSTMEGKQSCPHDTDFKYAAVAKFCLPDSAPLLWHPQSRPGGRAQTAARVSTFIS